MIQQVLINKDPYGYRIILDNNVTIAVNDEFIKGRDLARPHIRIETGHPSGDVLVYYSLRAVISQDVSNSLSKIGVKKF